MLSAGELCRIARQVSESAHSVSTPIQEVQGKDESVAKKDSTRVRHPVCLGEESLWRMNPRQRCGARGEHNMSELQRQLQSIGELQRRLLPRQVPQLTGW